MKVLEYSKWSNFASIIDKAKNACILSKNNVDNHFADAGKTIKMPKGAKKIIDNYKLSRYACYLIIQNGDSRKESIALAQTYFAMQTRKQEISELEYSLLLDNMSNDEFITNLFIVSQTEQKLKRENIKTETKSNQVYYEVGKEVRNTIKRLGEIRQKDMPTPRKSLKELEKEKKNKLLGSNI